MTVLRFSECHREDLVGSSISDIVFPTLYWVSACCLEIEAEVFETCAAALIGRYGSISKLSRLRAKQQVAPHYRLESR